MRVAIINLRCLIKAAKQCYFPVPVVGFSFYRINGLYETNLFSAKCQVGIRWNNNRFVHIVRFNFRALVNENRIWVKTE